VKPSDEERERLDTSILPGSSPRLAMLLKADASEAGEGWSDCQIAAALNIGVDTIARTRQQPMDEGFEAVLVRKHSSALGQKAHL
jgi:hypothetical protein